MRKANTLLLVILLLAVGAGIFYIFVNERKNLPEDSSSSRNPSATASPAPTATPEATAVSSTSPSPTWEPTPVPTAIPSATATAEPTPTPHIDHSASGLFRSDTGAWIDVVAKWETVEEDGKVRLKIDAYIESYSLFYTSYNPENLVFTVEGNTYRASHDPIAVGDNGGKTQTLLGTQIVDIPTGCDLNVDVTWFCTGLTYGNKKMDSITAKDTIHIP